MPTDLMTLLEQGWTHPMWQHPDSLPWAVGVMGAWAFLAATLLPVASEAALVALALKFPEHQVLLCVSATVGNTLGAATTFYFGRLMAVSKPIPAAWMARTSFQYVQRWGIGALLLSWVPLVGDAFVAAAGWMRFAWAPALLAIWLGKFGRYAALLWALGA